MEGEKKRKKRKKKKKKEPESVRIEPVGRGVDSLDLKEWGVALCLENFDRLGCAIRINSSLLPLLQVSNDFTSL